MRSRRCSFAAPSQATQPITTASQAKLQNSRYNARILKLTELVEDYASGLLNRGQLVQAKSVVEEALEATRAELAKVESGRVLTAIPVDKTIREA
jgi:predicted ATPase